MAGAHAQSISLDDALNGARANRQTVQAARLRVDQARLSRRALGSFPGTTLFLGYSSDPRVGGTDDDLVLSQPIDIFGRTAAARSTGDALVLQAEAAYRQTLADLQNEVVLVYSETAASKERVRIAKSSEELAARLVEATRGLVEGGKLPGVQATRASIELERVRASRELKEAELRGNQVRLAATIGNAEAEAFDASFVNLSSSEVSDVLLASQRADLLALSAEVRAAEADARVAKQSRLPQLELQGRRTGWQDADAAFGARIQLSFPLFDSGRSKSEVSAATRRSEAARRALEDAIRIARSELKAAAIEIAAANTQVSRLESVLSTTQELARKTEGGLREGVNTLLDVLDAFRALREIEEAIVEARLTLATAQAKLLRATGTLLGGGK